MGFRRFFLQSITLTPAMFLILWAFVVACPQGFMDEQFPLVESKRLMLDRCDLDEVLVLGDSNAAVGVDPKLFSVGVTNLALGLGKTIDAYYALSRALKCPKKPSLIILSSSAFGFTTVESFWDRSVKLRFLQTSDVEEVLDYGNSIKDRSIPNALGSDQLSQTLAQWKYITYFPSQFSRSLVQSALIGYYFRNSAGAESYVQARGHNLVSHSASNDDVSEDGRLPKFLFVPILDAYFNRLLDLAASHGLRIEFVVTPVNDRTWDATPDQTRSGFKAYLLHKALEHRNLDIITSERMAWPSHYFADKFGHLNEDGISLFSRRLSECVSVARGTHLATMTCKHLLARPID